MIALVAVAIGGLIVGLKIPLLLLPLIYITKFKNKKEIFLLLFFIYALAIGYEFEVANLYESGLIEELSIIVPSLLLLDSGLRSKEEKSSFAPIQIAFIIAFVIGWFVREIFVVAVLGVLLYELSKDNPGKGILAGTIGLSSLVISLALGKALLNFEGSAATEVVFISAVSTLVVLTFFWKKVERIKFARL